MSKSLSAAAQQEFDSLVQHEFQKSGILRPTVTVRNGVVGDSYKFRKIGKGMANQKVSQADVTPMDVSHSLITCTLENWVAPEYSDIFDAAEVNFDEKMELATVIASAMGRRGDQLIIDALAAEASPAATIVHGSAGLTLAKITQTVKTLVDKGVPQDGKLHFVTSAAGLEDMLNDSTITSQDYNSVKALVNGEINTFAGFKWHIVETRDEGGLPLSGTTRTCFAYHETAIGMAVGMDIRTEVNYVPTKTSWLCNGLFKAGAVSRNGNGIVHVEITE